MSLTDAFTTTTPDDTLKTSFFADYNGSGSLFEDGVTNYSVNVWLYADTAFSTWVAAFDNSETEDEKNFRDEYSDYMMRMRCDITAVDSIVDLVNRAGMGCCLWDKENQGGGFCSLLNTTPDGLETFYLTNAQFQTAYEANELSTDNYGPSVDYPGVTTFWMFEDAGDATITDSTDYDYWTVMKI